jgi:glycosyltransferase involved in cell wall biosynthesis
MRHSFHILFTCGREPEYTRNDVILRALRSHYPMAEITDSRLGSLTARLLRLTPRLIRALRRPHDLVVVGFYGYPLVWMIRRFTRRPILFDAFLLTHDTLVEDRRRFGPNSFVARLAMAVDRLGGRAADRILLDTQTQAAWFSQVTGVAPARVSPLFVGCNEGLFHPAVLPDRPPDGNFYVLYYGTYQPLHGMETVVAAARLLVHYPAIRWRIIGRGQMYPRVRRMAEEWGLTNVEFQASLPYADLPGAIAAADLCLGGPFGATDKARRVITGKTFQFLSMRKPVVVSDTPANHELLVPEASACFVPIADSYALAAAVHALQGDAERRQLLATGGHARYEDRASEAVIGARLRGIIEEMLT